MKNNKEKFSDGSKEGASLLIDSLLDVGTNMGAELLKDSVTNMASELMIDTVSSLIPGVGGAISSYKRIRTEKNLKTLIFHLKENNDELIANLRKQTEENREKLDSLLQFILEKVIDEYQEEKIEYMVNGYIYLTDHAEITSDFVMHYYDVLKQLRMVDISVLRLYYKNRYFFDGGEDRETFSDVMERHGMSYDQYNSVRESLRRIGLLELQVKDDIDDDMTKLEDGVNQIVKYIEHINRNKKTRAPKISKIKIKQRSKENIKLSRFGNDFYHFFGDV